MKSSMKLLARKCLNRVGLSLLVGLLLECSPIDKAVATGQAWQRADIPHW